MARNFICTSLILLPLALLAGGEIVIDNLSKYFRDDCFVSDRILIQGVDDKDRSTYDFMNEVARVQDKKVYEKIVNMTLARYESFDPYSLTNRCVNGLHGVASDRAMFMHTLLSMSGCKSNPSPELLRRIAKRLGKIDYSRQEERFRSLVSAIRGYRFSWIGWINRTLKVLARDIGDEKTKELAAELCDLMNADKEEREKVFKRFK